MNDDYRKYEGLVGGNGNPFWNQSYYYQFYDPETKVGAFIRMGFMENRREMNNWFVFFQDGMPIYTRSNVNIPYSYDRPLNGVKIAGMYVHAVDPLKTTRILFSDVDFSVDLVWDEIYPMHDSVAMTDTDSTFSKEMANIHLEGVSRITGHITHRGKRIEIDGTGFRDISCGPRRFDSLKYYRLAWPVFEDGRAFAGLQAISTTGQSTDMRLYHDGQKWLKVKTIEAQQTFAEDGFSVKSAVWKFVDENDKEYEFTCEPLMNYFFPQGTVYQCEQLMKYVMSDGTVGYGLAENGFYLPWEGIEI